MNQKRDSFPWLWAIAIISGLVYVALGIALVAISLLLPSAVETASIAAIGYSFLALLLGVGLGVAGVRGWRRLPALSCYSRWGWLVFLIFTVVIGVLGALLPPKLQAQPLFALLYTALIVLPGLALFSLVLLASGSGVVCRHVMVTLAGGAASILLAFPVELVGLVVSGGASLMLALLIPCGRVEVERLMSLFSSWVSHPPTSEQEVLQFLASPVIMLTLALTLGVVTPVVEEFGKGIIVGIMGVWARPAVLTTFIWGVACGLGFAWFEGISNGALSFGVAAGWIGGVVTRFFATGLHCLTSGIVGMGWGWYWRGRKWVLPVFYGVAVLFHSLWNANVLLSLGVLGAMTTRSNVANLVAGIGIAIQVILAFFALVALMGVPVWLRRHPSTCEAAY